MKTYLFPFAIFAFLMLLIDTVWLGVMVKRFYTPKIGHLMAETPNLRPASLFYIIYVLGVTVFVLVPGMKSSSGLFEIFLMGALYGIATYGTYDLTNQATLKDWPAIVTAVDIVWGALLTGTVSLSTVAILRAL